MSRPERLTSMSLVMGAIASVQLGAAVATTLFDELGPAGTVLLRTGFAAVALVVVWRPHLHGRTHGALRDAALYGLTLAAMNLSFYGALDRIPLGIAVTLEFTGPFAVAVAGSRRASDLLWVALAAAGIVLLSPGVHGSLDTTGALLALLAGVFWAAYIVLAARVGRAFSGGQGLTLAMLVATLVLLPSGIVAGGSDLGDPALLAAGLAIALLSSAIPYSLELEALRRLPKGTFGVLMSLEPAVAALVGLVALGQELSADEVVAIALVVAASAGALSAARTPSPVEA
ncbi:MAG TPA: EamA family transporter [Solirubrobacterales bacterium]|nr:EamA family transporter [Solirubrobacterales bacterium]